jgi:flagellar basal-body rod protein FlgF
VVIPMPDPIVAYANLIRAKIDSLNSIAQNSSNVNSAGYLQEISHIDHQQFVSLINGNVSTEKHAIHHSTKLGSIKVTGRGADLALTSDHWFVVSKGTDLFVTRNGNFSVNTEGELKLGEYSVMGDTGVIRGLSQDFLVSGDATVSVDKGLVDKLKIVKIPSRVSLHSIGNGVYQSSNGWTDGERIEVVQGALNSSNVDIQADMTRVIETTRQIESIQRAISAYNDVMDAGINQLGK